MIFRSYSKYLLLVLVATAGTFENGIMAQSEPVQQVNNSVQQETQQTNVVVQPAQSNTVGQVTPQPVDTTTVQANANQTALQPATTASNNEAETRLRDVLHLMIKRVTNGTDVLQDYNSLVLTNYKIIKECIEKQSIANTEAAESIWKQLLEENKDGINLLKQKLSAADNTKQYPLDSIADMNNYYVTVSFPDTLISKLLTTNTWYEFANEFTTSINSIQESQQKLFVEDMNKMLNVLLNSTQVYGKQILDHITKLQNADQKEYSIHLYGGSDLYDTDAIIFMSDLQNRIINNQIKTIDVVKQYYDDIILHDPKDYIYKKQREICNGNAPVEDTPYILYFIKTSNPWAIQYTKSKFVYLFNENNGDISKFKEEINKLPESEIKTQYNNIFSQDIKTAIKVLIENEKEDVITEMKDRLDSIKSAENTYYFDRAYEEWLQGLLAIDIAYLKYLQPNDQQEVINDLITNIWTVYNDTNLQNVINNYLNGTYTKPQQTTNEQYMMSLHEKIKNILNNAEFKTKTPFEQFKQLITIAPTE